MASSHNGDIGRWYLNEEESGTMETAEENMRDALHEAAEALIVISILVEEDGISTHLAVSDGDITAQTVLAAVEDDKISIGEDGKDQVEEE